MARRQFFVGVMLVFGCWASISGAVSLEDQLQQLRINFVRIHVI